MQTKIRIRFDEGYNMCHKLRSKCAQSTEYGIPTHIHVCVYDRDGSRGYEDGIAQGPELEMCASAKTKKKTTTKRTCCSIPHDMVTPLFVSHIVLFLSFCSFVRSTPRPMAPPTRFLVSQICNVTLHICVFVFLGKRKSTRRHWYLKSVQQALITASCMKVASSQHPGTAVDCCSAADMHRCTSTILPSWIKGGHPSTPTLPPVISVVLVPLNFHPVCSGMAGQDSWTHDALLRR